MAIIKRKDIYDDSKSAFDNLLKDLEKLNTEVVTLTKSNVKLSQSLQTVKKSGNGTEAKELVKLTNQLNTSTNKLNISTNEQSKKLAEVKVKQQELNKANKQAARDSLGLVNAYEKLTKKTTEAQKKFKNLATEFGVNSKQAKKAKQEFQKLDNQLSKVNKTARDGRKDVGRYGTAFAGLGKQLLGGLGLIAGFQALTRIVKDAFKTFVEFEKAGSKLASILGKTKGEIKALTNQAKQLGATTAFTATQVIQLQTELAKLGFTTTEIKNSTAAILDLAAATGSELASAAELAGATLRIFNLDSSEMSRVTDVLALSTSKSSLSMEKLATIMPTVGKTAQIAGVSLERTAALAGTLTDRGLDASTAGTALRNIFLKLAKDGRTWDGAMSEMNGSTDKLKTSIELFGIRSSAAGIILSETKDGVNELTDAFLDADGAAKDMADTMRDNVAGDITLASSAWTGFVLSVADGEGVISKAIRRIVQGFTEFIGTLTLFNETSTLNRLKLLGNGFIRLIEKAFIPFISVLETLGIEVPKFRFEIEEANKSIKKNQEHVAKSTKTNEEEEKVIVKLTAAQKKRVAEEKALNDAFKARDSGIIAPLESLGADKITLKADENSKLLALEESHLEDLSNLRTIAVEEDVEAEQAIKEQAISSSQQLASDIFSSFQDEKLAQINSDAEAEKKILQQKLDDGIISEEQFAAQSAAIDKKQRIAAAKADKKKAIFDIFIATAIAVAKAGFITPAAIAIGAAGLIQAGAVAAKPIPKFAKGEVNIKGKSHAQGGIDTNIEGGESFINKSATANSEALLNGINSGLITDKNLPSMTNQNNNMLIASLLMNGNSTNKQLLQAMLNMGYSYDRSGVRHIIKADGSGVEQFNIG